MEWKILESYNINGSYRINFEYPEIDECPICHFAIQPKILYTCYVENNDGFGYCTLYILFYCSKCRQAFLAKYLERKHGVEYQFAGHYELAPITPNSEGFSQQINTLSPTFALTYAQSQQAEASGLTEICGIGYRKSLEYLVKDYLCHIYPEQEEEIKRELLGKSIKRIENGKIKTLAERATWIGNDETHYIRKHEDLDINVMKRFILAMVRYVDSELAFEEADAIDPA